MPFWGADPEFSLDGRTETVRGPPIPRPGDGLAAAPGPAAPATPVTDGDDGGLGGNVLVLERSTRRQRHLAAALASTSTH